VHGLASQSAGRLPLALARIHAETRAGARVRLELPGVERAAARELLLGAGFSALRTRRVGSVLRVDARREHTLPDLVGPGLRLLVCGLNPSLYSAERGIPFARPGNRFWPAAVRAGLVASEGDPLGAFECGIGFTDCVKRATARAAELHPEEYTRGIARVERLVAHYRPAVTCFVGLDGWRRAIDRRARAGPTARGLGGRPAYLMPSTSGLNAHCQLEDLAAHLRAARRLA
jgi:TDG/mug DNA glycosylase family protein